MKTQIIEKDKEISTLSSPKKQINTKSKEVPTAVINRIDDF